MPELQAKQVPGKIWQRVLDRFAHSVSLDGVRIPIDRKVLTRDEIKSLVRHHYEREERAIVNSVVEPSDVVLEIGGGIGLISALLAKNCPPENVTVFEANPGLVDLIASTHKANGIDGIQVRNAAVVPDDIIAGTCDFYIGEKFWSCSLIPRPGWRRIQVPAIRFSEAIADRRYSFLIMDVEGAEYSLLGKPDIPKSVRKICVETHPESNCHNIDLNRVLSLQGFRLDRFWSHKRVKYFERE